MFNAYPDSIGNRLSDLIETLNFTEFENAFSLFYILPSFFNNDLDRGFSIIDYNINKELVYEKDIKDLKDMGIILKFDIVLNHLSVASPQFKDLVLNGAESEYENFFINWNKFWNGHGAMNEEGVIIPDKQYLDILFMRKPGLPILKILFPGGKEIPYWNTFYQKLSYEKLKEEELVVISDIDSDSYITICQIVNQCLENNGDLDQLNLEKHENHRDKILQLVKSRPVYLGQMDLNARSPKVWQFYEETLSKLADYGCSILRLDAFAYLHKEVGLSNFFNKPGTWEYLSRIEEMAKGKGLTILPEIHAEYGSHIHEDVARAGYMIYDFFLPGLMIHTIEKKSSKALIKWINDIINKDLRTINMLGCHDGIPVLDLKGKRRNNVYLPGLLRDEEIEDIMDLILRRGGRVKNIYDAEGNKISYYQVNATYFSALGNNEEKLLLARAIQMFMPGIPQVWYLDLFAGSNDYQAVDKAGQGGHKEINRSNLSMEEVRYRMQFPIVQDQLDIIRLRNTHKAFDGNIEIRESKENELILWWTNGDHFAQLTADLSGHTFSIKSSD
ncbi:MAG: glycosidase [Saprospiraceae bacterium]|nr:glycosidase [Saprospiraceae bacterium]